ncbi:MAG: thioredoxin [Bacilli bacterium]|jgi:thioredoxin 1
MYIKVNSVEEFNRILAENKVVMVDFYADWCGPCRMLSPAMEEIGNTMPDKVVVKVDVDQLNVLAYQYRVQSIPNVVFFQNGKEVDRSIGFRPKQHFIDKLNSLA